MGVGAIQMASDTPSRSSNINGLLELLSRVVMTPTRYAGDEGCLRRRSPGVTIAARFGCSALMGALGWRSTWCLVMSGRLRGQRPWSDGIRAGDDPENSDPRRRSSCVAPGRVAESLLEQLAGPAAERSLRLDHCVHRIVRVGHSVRRIVCEKIGRDDVVQAFDRDFTLARRLDRASGGAVSTRQSGRCRGRCARGRRGISVGLPAETSASAFSIRRPGRVMDRLDPGDQGIDVPCPEGGLGVASAVCRLAIGFRPLQFGKGLIIVAKGQSARNAGAVCRGVVLGDQARKGVILVIFVLLVEPVVQDRSQPGDLAGRRRGHGLRGDLAREQRVPDAEEQGAGPSDPARASAAHHPSRPSPARPQRVPARRRS